MKNKMERDGKELFLKTVSCSHRRYFCLLKKVRKTEGGRGKEKKKQNKSGAENRKGVGYWAVSQIRKDIEKPTYLSITYIIRQIKFHVLFIFLYLSTNKYK